MATIQLINLKLLENFLKFSIIFICSNLLNQAQLLPLSQYDIRLSIV